MNRSKFAGKEASIERQSKETEAVIEYKARIDDVIIHGVDIFTIDEAGKAKELTVMLRPTKALTALGEIEDKFVREHLSKIQGS